MSQHLHSPSEIVKTVRNRRFAAQCRVRDAVVLRDVIQQPTDYRYGEAHLAAVDARSEDRFAELVQLVWTGRIRPDNCARYVHAITYPTTAIIYGLKRLYLKGYISRAALEAAFDRYDDRCTYGFRTKNGGYHVKDRLDREWRERVRLANRRKSCAPVDGDGIVRTGRTKMVDGERLPIVRVIEEQDQ